MNAKEWKVLFKCLSCFSSPSCLSCLSSLSCLTCLRYFFPEAVAKCLLKWPAWKVFMIVFVWKMEVVHKQVRGCLILHNLQLACFFRKLEVIWTAVRAVLRRSLWMINHESINEWLTDLYSSRAARVAEYNLLSNYNLIIHTIRQQNQDTKGQRVLRMSSVTLVGLPCHPLI